MTSTVEDYMLEMHKLIINKWCDAAFPIGIKDDGETHKEPLCTLLFNTELTQILVGLALPDIKRWMEEPWLMLAVQLWFKILLQYEGITENVNSNFMHWQ
eukprot:3597128-Rhodomonas_salina.1